MSKYCDGIFHPSVARIKSSKALFDSRVWWHTSLRNPRPLIFYAKLMREGNIKHMRKKIITKIMKSCTKYEQKNAIVLWGWLSQCQFIIIMSAFCIWTSLLPANYISIGQHSFHSLCFIYAFVAILIRLFTGNSCKSFL